MERLRAPGGCPWDRKQTYGSICPHVIEEAYELVDAVAEGSMEGLCEEAGDLLLQVVFMGVIAEELGDFTLDDVIQGISSKLVRRHPHVFGELSVTDSDQVLRNWERIKLQEKGGQDSGASVLSGVPKGLPPLIKAFRVQDKAAHVGFDWEPENQEPVFQKITEEVIEVREAMKSGDKNQLSREIGDVLFSVVNLARRLGVDPHQALEATNKKFIRRFEHIEEDLRSRGVAWEDTDLTELDVLWEQAKKASSRKDALGKPL
ncbi:MAG: nucleoside triphosphate pyrophosphohydrolase [Dethiosulfovibrio peptidovorans]|nr:MAG: nucleoside triphosphate pyrophosphohydrolase [Dethiosulfovibrio peptidovorans]